MKKKKLLFVENRTATYSYDKVSAHLNKRYDIHWIVQNHFYIPKNGTKHIIKYPEKKDLKKIDARKYFKKIYFSDRARKHFHQNTSHYFYYYNQIEKILKKIKPDLIIGEADLFHELMIIEIAKKMGIRYIFPTGTRYPTNRISFLKYDNLNPIANNINKNKISIKESKKFINQVLKHKYKLFYMKKESIKAKLKKRYSQVCVGISYIMGDKYNTPSPLKFFKLNLEKKFVRFLWFFLTFKNEKRFNKIIDDKKFILYPLQIEPEASNDVWSYPYNNQYEIILELAKRLKKINYILAIKINPKSKFELKILSLIKISKISNIILIPKKFSTFYLIKKCFGIFSVTGTVIIESVMHKKPIYTLSNHFLSSFVGVTKVKNYEHLAYKIKNYKNLKSDKDKTLNQVLLLKRIYKYSFPFNGSIYSTSNKFRKTHKLLANYIAMIERYENF